MMSTVLEGVVFGCANTESAIKLNAKARTLFLTAKIWAIQFFKPIRFKGYYSILNYKNKKMFGATT